MTALVDHLATLDPSALSALLRLRQEAVAGPPPRDLSELAQRLSGAYAVSDLLVPASLPVLQLAEALQALGGRAPTATLRRLLGVDDDGDDGGDEGPLEAPLRWLAERAVVVRTEGGVLVGSPALADCFPSPLGLQSPLTVLLPQQNATTLQKALKALGESPPSRKAECVEALHAVLSDARRVRAVVAGAPAAVRGELARMAADDDVDPMGERALSRFEDPGAYRRERQAVQWAATRGLVVASPWGYGPTMPAEVELALRGEDFRAPFTPSRPDVATRPAAPEVVARDSAANASTAAGHATAFADLVRRAPVAVLQAGGVGARELKRLGKELAVAETEVRLVLELAQGAGLLAHGGGGIGPGEAMDTWRGSSPAEQFTALLVTWWASPKVVTTSTEDGRTAPALVGAGHRGYPEARAALLQALAELPEGEGTEVADLAPAVLWNRPLVHEGAGVAPFGRTWREAELLGVVAAGALSPLGRALLAGDPEALLDRAREVLPAEADRALIGPDLTAVVPGTPSARVTGLLDRCADREGRGGAVVWRITPGGVRRALDEGMTGEQLQAQLAEVAGGRLPQPLEYLLADVARRHGSLRVRPAVAVVHGDDEALLAQAAADRSLEKLGLALLSPTVLTSTQDDATTLSALRAAGYLPMAEDATGSVVTRPDRPAAPASTSRRRPTRDDRPTFVADALIDAPTATSAAPLDVDALAARLVDAGVGDGAGAPADPDSTEATVRALAPRLPAAEVRLLAHAVDQQEDVVIEYAAASGGVSHRRIGEAELVGGSLAAWCYLREDDRHFAVGRIRSVRPAG